jgi:hypothetical protein
MGFPPWERGSDRFSVWDCLAWGMLQTLTEDKAKEQGKLVAEAATRTP